MRIILNQKYAVGSDKYSFKILRANKRKRSGNQVIEWKPIAWYSNLELLIEGFAEHQIRMSNVETLTELLQFKQDLMAALGASLPANFRKVA